MEDIWRNKYYEQWKDIIKKDKNRGEKKVLSYFNKLETIGVCISLNNEQIGYINTFLQEIEK